VPTRDRLALSALGFGIAAALSSWSPLSAPFGALVGVVALVLGVRAYRRAARRRLPAAAVIISALAVLASAVVLALTAGVGRELGGSPVVEAPRGADVKRELDQAAERTGASRERARRELDSLGQSGEQAPQDDRAPKR
jgi:hypothetical protein